jgi:hypothetical protein
MTTRKPQILIAAAAAAMFAAAPGAGAQAPEENAPGAEAGVSAVDYAPLDEYLDVFGVPAGKRLKFKFEASKDVGSKYLRQYTEQLAKTSPATLAADDQLAFWLNLRNALVLAHLSETGGRANMKKDRGDAAAPGEAWTAKVVTVDGAALSIDDIERGVILKTWKDPRVVYGLYQGTTGGPPAEKKAFRGETVWTELAAAGKKYMTSTAGFELTKKSAEVSAVFGWYDDALFGGDEAALRAHLSTLITHGARINLEKTPSIAFKEFSYKTDAYVERIVDQTIAGEQRRQPPPQSYPTGS